MPHITLSAPANYPHIAPAERFPWMESAVCAQTDVEVFFPDKGAFNTVKAAKRVCDNCPVRRECLEYAIGNNERYGVWGGLSERERRDLRRAS